ncbi:LOW QUALITY PROTEIN: uncharacterized protein LOC135449682 [Zonotrichia leucophrys gambelii]|uniref:LOW QUALITY PROTEIN: uncharacterized protein LOC135449682 n=1 Tax=Zonotrichia leucophrys gambelii TaxID=257770 RepID=UPI0031401A5C
MDIRSQPGPIRMRHVWQQQRRAKKPYSRPQIHSSNKSCMLCHHTQDNDICGDKRMKFKLCVHTYCQILATGLYPREDTGHFLVGDTRRIIMEATKKVGMTWQEEQAALHQERLRQLLLLPSKEAPGLAHTGASGARGSGALSGLCPHPTHSPVMQRDHKSPVLTFMGLLCSFQTCFICCKMGATITCCQTGCDRTFHLPCAPDGQCVTQYFGAYRSFCWEHRPQQALRPRPSQDNTCAICLDTVEDNISYKTMGCPACQDARFHRHCIQRLALHAGIDFRCPRCLKQEPFTTEMLAMGIRLSKRPPSWQTDPEVGPSDQRHGRCDATTCLCPGGREHTEAHGRWQLRLCSSCAAEGIHQLCSSLGNSTCSWECSTCAATDTGRQQSIQHYARHTGTTMGLAPGPSAQLGSRRALDTTAASSACSLGTVLTTFILPVPLCRFHWQIRPCGPQKIEHRTADSVPGHGAPQELLLHQPSAGFKAEPH